MVHIRFVAIPAVPIIVIAFPPPFNWETLLMSIAMAAATTIGRLAWNYMVRRHRTA